VILPALDPEDLIFLEDKIKKGDNFAIRAGECLLYRVRLKKSPSNTRQSNLSKAPIYNEEN